MNNLVLYSAIPPLGEEPIGRQVDQVLAQIKARRVGSASASKSEKLGSALAELLDSEYGRSLEPKIREMIHLVQQVRHSQGRPLYDESAISVLVHEIVYTSHLHRDRRRKTGAEGYFDAHLIAAFINTARSGFTGISNLVAALHHDDIEDLAIHHADGNANGAYQPQMSLLTCDELYPEAAEELEAEIQRAWVAVRTLTSPKVSAAQKAIVDERKAYEYLQNLCSNGYAAVIKVIEQIQNAQTMNGLSEGRRKEKMRTMLIMHGLFARILGLEFAEACIVEEGVHIFRPNVLLEYQRLQKEQIAALSGSFSRLFIPKARAEYGSRIRDAVTGLLAASSVEARSLGLMLGRLEASSDERQLAKQLQMGRKLDNSSLRTLMVELLNALGSKPKAGRESQSAGSPLEHLVDSYLMGEVESERAAFRETIASTLTPHVHGVRAIQIRPISIAKFIDVRRLADDPVYDPVIPPFEPLFEVLVLVDPSSDLRSVANKIAQSIGASRMSIAPEGSASSMKGLCLKAETAEGFLRVRVNDVKSEALATRGVRARESARANNPIPTETASKINRVLEVARATGRPVTKVAEEILLRRKISVFTDLHPRREISLIEGATFLDFAAALPGDMARDALLYRTRAFRRTPSGTREEVSLFDEVREGDHIFIELNKEGPVQARLADFTFTREGKACEVLHKYFDQEADKCHAQENSAPLPASEKAKIRKSKRVERAEAYLTELAGIFGLEPELLPLAVYQCVESSIYNDAGPETFAKESYDTKRTELLNKIARGHFDPLDALSLYLLQSVPNGIVSVEIEMNDRKGIFGEAATLVTREGINMAEVSGGVIPNDARHSVLKMSMQVGPEKMNSALLRLILKLSYFGKVKVTPCLFDLSSLQPQMDLLQTSAVLHLAS